MRRAGLLATLCCVLPLALPGEEYEDVLRRTDMASADAVFELAQWCAANNRATLARRYYQEIIAKLDKDHEGARQALGFVRVGDRWVNKAFAPAGAGKDAKPGGDRPGEAPVRRASSGPGPTAEQVTWDLAPPADPEPANTWVDQFIERMPRIANDSDAMDSGVRTLLRPDDWRLAFPRLCRALLRPDFNDIYGAAEICRSLYASGRAEDARRLLPFIFAASTRITHAEDLRAACMVAALLRDRRTVPRLIQLMGNEQVARDARDALAAITMLPAKSLTAAQAQEWWDRNWDVPPEVTCASSCAMPIPPSAWPPAKGSTSSAIPPSCRC